nr:class II aldolase/adducin family protein [Paraburkholderia sp. J41]
MSVTAIAAPAYGATDADPRQTPDRKCWFDDEAPARTAGAERRCRRKRPAGAFRLFARHGFDRGLAGHVTARDPEWPDHFRVNPLGLHFGRVKDSGLLLVNRHGEIAVGAGPANQAAFAVHAAVHAVIHEARPEVVAAVNTHTHAHSQAGRAAGARHAFESLHAGLVEREPELLD